MKFFFSIITSVFLFLGITPIALAANGPALNADRASTEYTASALQNALKILNLLREQILQLLKKTSQDSKDTEKHHAEMMVFHI